MNLLYRTIVWFGILIMAIAGLLAFNQYFYFPEIKAILTGVACICLNVFMSNCVLFSYTKVDFQNDESKENIGRIYQGNAIIISVVFAGYFFTQV